MLAGFSAQARDRESHARRKLAGGAHLVDARKATAKNRARIRCVELGGSAALPRKCCKAKVLKPK